MRKRIVLGVKTLVFLGILGICVCWVNSILIPDYVDDTAFPTSATYKGFYEMEENSVDVIFLGSSRASCAFSPQELYNMYGIRSYNLGCEMQNVLVSYYWLKEALRFQSPQVVVLETSMIFPYWEDYPLNTSIESTRKAMDYMKWSNIKYQAVKDICNYDKSQKWESYVFPNIQYHERWEKLSRNDFETRELYGNLKLKGQTILYDIKLDWDEESAYELSNINEKEKMQGVMEKYLDKIVDLCKREDIKLMLVSVPSAYSSIEKYNTMSVYADAKKIDYIDYNELRKYEAIQYDYFKDNAEYSHVGLKGTYKIAQDIGNILIEYFGITSNVDNQWEETKNYYEQVEEEMAMLEINNVEEYLGMLNNPNYSIFIVAQNVNIFDEIPLHIKNSLGQLDLNNEFWREDAGNRYYAVIDETDVVEKNHHAPISLNGTLLQGKIQYSVMSDVNESSIIIDGVECSKQREGLNIVVYSNVRNRLVDSIALTFENGIGSITR